MKDIIESLNRAMSAQGWIFGDKVTRIGCPYEWTENQNKANILDREGLQAMAFYYSMFYVGKPTPDSFKIEEHDDVLDHCLKVLSNVFSIFMPFLAEDSYWKNNIECQALIRTQDYCYIKKHCSELPSNPTHMDIGCGLGSSAIYSLKFLKANYIGLEASPMSIAVQRDFLKHIAPKPGSYLDSIAMENFEAPHEDLVRAINSPEKYSLRHLPSWHWPFLADASLDLVSACYVLNELNYAGILWILAHVTRTLKEGGYFYIRDSAILKPGMHALDYDQVLQDLDFEEVARLNLENRHDFYGIPRVYRKTSSTALSFDEMAERCIGKFASVAGGGHRSYNMPAKDMGQ